MREVMLEEAEAEQVVEERVTIPAKILKMRHILAASPEAFVQVHPSKVYVCDGHCFLIGFEWETGARESFQFPASVLLRVPGVNRKNLRTYQDIEIIKRNEPDGAKLWLSWGFGTIPLNGGNPVKCTPVTYLNFLLDTKKREGPTLFYSQLKELVEAIEALGAFPESAEVMLEYLEGDVGQRVVALRIRGYELGNAHGVMVAKVPENHGEAGESLPS